MEQSGPMACPDCHALADDLAAHEAWHSRLVRDLAVAVDRENKRRDAAQPHSTPPPYPLTPGQRPG